MCQCVSTPAAWPAPENPLALLFRHLPSAPRCRTIQRMTVALVRYDACRKALASALRIDEVKHIHDKATALLAYAKQAGDYALQNQAAEIRLLAERRAGQLLVDMQVTGQRWRQERGRPTKVYPSSTHMPTTLPKLGISRNQSSKWQRLALMIDDATFERALTRAKEEFGELTTSGVLRLVKEIMKPAVVVVEPDINVVAAELVREIESASRKDKLQAVIRLRNRLNPTVRKQLIAALKNAAKDSAAFGEQLSKDFQEFTTNGKAHQRVIRERMAQFPEADIEEKRRLAADFKHAIVREISYDEAKNVILGNEWLGNMGTTEFSYGLFFGSHLGGVACYGSTAGTHVAASICGQEHRHKVITLCRGAAIHWAHPHSASFLIAEACRQMTKKGYHIFVAYSDPEASEIGTIYQASNWDYCGMTSSTEKFRTPDGKIHDSRQVHGLTRDRTGGGLKYKRSRAEQKKLLIAQGCEFLDGKSKHKYIGIYGNRRIKRVLRSALRWESLPYPKREQAAVAPTPNA
jgi:hypothetical protein